MINLRWATESRLVRAAVIVRVAARRACGAVGAAVLLFIVWLMLGLPLGIDAWLNVSVRPVNADAIVCIGGGTGVPNVPLQVGWERIYTAVQLFADGYAPIVVFTGRGSTRLSEAETYADAAAWLGLPQEAMLLEPSATSTAEHPLGLLQSSGGRLTRQSRLLLVTSPLHSRRVLLVFQKQGFTNVRVVTRYRSVGRTAAPARDAKVSTRGGSVWRMTRRRESGVDRLAQDRETLRAWLLPDSQT